MADKKPPAPKKKPAAAAKASAAPKTRPAPPPKPAAKPSLSSQPANGPSAEAAIDNVKAVIEWLSIVDDFKIASHKNFLPRWAFVVVVLAYLVIT